MHPHPKPRYWRSCLIALCCTLAACSQETPPEPPAPLVELVRVGAFDLEERIESTGELRAVERATIAAEIGGRVTEVLRDESDAVEADEVLLRIDPEKRELELANARAQLSEATASVNEARREQRRIAQLHERGATSEALLDAANTTLESARSRLRAVEAQLGVAERALRDAEVRAPFAGLIARRTVSRGEFVTPGHSLYELVAMDPVEVQFHLPERDSGRVALGQPVAVRVAPQPERVFEARVSMVSPTIDARTRTLRVEARLPNPAGELRPGLFALVDLGVARRSGIVMVPEQSVMQRALGPMVFMVDDDGRVEKREVETGEHRPGAVEIRSGIEAGEWVVASGQARLVDGLVVRTQRRDEPFAPAHLAAAGTPEPASP
ncbi:MAG: efflux RND transporter periplasmic adaptor subunit [Myxococcota bacterium]|jgi:membrane fusion protein (multidrug efflux system)|nr:efflux RND transporter periplasmic adaptor subunit [Myxococcota bacterium]